MKRLLTLAGVGALLLVLTPTPVSAQFFEVLAARLNDVTSDPFGCTGGVPCNLYQRYYPDGDPTLINGPNGPVDGYPVYKAFPDRFVGDEQQASNYPGFNDPSKACEAWYSIWTGVTDPGTGIHISYYAAQSTIVNNGEQGHSSTRDCTPPPGENIRGIACFGATDATSALNISTGTPQGSIAPLGGLEPVPVPTVVTVPAIPDTVQMSWPAANNINTVNLPSASSVPCPAGSTFDDLVDTNGPNPIHGVRLYVHSISNGGSFRSLVSMEGSSLTGTRLTALQNPGSQLACTGVVDCPGIHVMPCTSVNGGTCASDGVSFLPTSQIITLDKATIDSILGFDGPLDTGNNAVFNTKVVFRGAVPGSHAKPSVSEVNPSLMSGFSANSTRVSFGALVARLAFERTVVAGNRVTLSWTTFGTGSFLEFRLERADNSLNFVPLAIVPATEAISYTYTDTIRGRGRSGSLYRLIGVEPEPAGESQIFTQVKFSNSPRLNRRGR